MTRHLFRHLRRCRALFALALCAWLTLASVAWAQDDCCASMTAPVGMSMSHGMDMHGHDAGHPATTMPDGCCAHATVNVPVVQAQNLPQVAPESADWRPYRQVAPQPVYEPPLRPPVA
ncbi:hypothetical protein [Dyella sp. 20L07]|uniref:hypothetical protein n=1 Tax=Dyella sp. 20L07 TaxID=3384240 RepID=UPI003D299991